MNEINNNEDITIDRMITRVKMTQIRFLTLIVFLWGLTVLPMFAVTASALENGDCLDCHGEKDFTTTRGDKEVSLYVDADVFSGSIHGENGIACVDCHADIEDIPHADRLAPVDCAACHDEAAGSFAGSIHASSNSATCKNCHGTHDILPANNPQSKVYPLNIPSTCGSCHSNSDIVGEEAAVATLYEQGQHGMATSKGMLGAAICTDCHGNHDILSTADPDSPANRKNIVTTCGKCHVGSVRVYDKSIHGMLRAEGTDEAPTCADCHKPHKTERVDTTEFVLGNIDTCGKCHPHALETYRASYHGQITDLGFTNMARCATCHGSHDILPPDNPESRMNEARRLDTCKKCHPSATKNFIGFAPHLDHHDYEKYPVESITFKLMSALLLNVFLIFSFHTLLWYIRGLIEKVKKEGPPHLGNPTGRYFLRFNYYHRITHFLIFTSFITLALTGLPLKFHHTAWAKLLAACFGGFKVAGTLHRMMGAVTFGYFAMHLAYLAYLLISGRMKLTQILWGPRSIVPQPNDAFEIADNVKWFLGLGPRPKFGRFTYWEKFDYFAVFWGVALIGLSGLVLWLPTLFTWLLPGIVINLSWIIHADEALLATGFIFLIHFFNTHLRVEKFPLDPVILTGRIDEEEMRHERPKEFALRREDGSILEIQTTAPPRWLMNFSRAVGWTFVAIGFALLIGMLASFFV